MKCTDNPSISALYSLPEKYRSALILSDIYLFTLPQISNIFGISEKAVQKRIGKGRSKISRIIKKQISK